MSLLLNLVISNSISIQLLWRAWICFVFYSSNSSAKAQNNMPPCISLHNAYLSLAMLIIMLISLSFAESESYLISMIFSTGGWHHVVVAFTFWTLSLACHEVTCVCWEERQGCINYRTLFIHDSCAWREALCKGRKRLLKCSRIEEWMRTSDV